MAPSWSPIRTAWAISISTPFSLSTASHGKLATVTAVQPPARFGNLEIEDDRVVEFTQKLRERETWINGGFFVFEPGVLDYLPGDDEPLEQSPLANLARDGQLFAYKHPGFWHPMDTVRDRDYLNGLCAGATPPWMEFDRAPAEPLFLASREDLSPNMAASFEQPLRDALHGRRVLLTGHTGFKGGWLSLWLKRLGAEVVGVSLPPPAGPSLYASVGLDALVDDRIGDIRSPQSFGESVAGVDADIVIHMAAQSLVRAFLPQSGRYLFDQCRRDGGGARCRAEDAIAAGGHRGDERQVLREPGWLWGYRESIRWAAAIPIVARDARSSSPSVSQLVLCREAGRGRQGPRRQRVGGGDWAEDRLMPDRCAAASRAVASKSATRRDASLAARPRATDAAT